MFPSHDQKVKRVKRMGFQKRSTRLAKRPWSSGELKGVDTGLSVSPVIATTNTNGNITAVNLIQQGAGSWNRVGRKVHLKSVRICITATCFTAIAATTFDIESNRLRMILVWDKQPSGTLPTFDTIFGRTDQTGSESSTVNDPLRYDNTDRFRVLRDIRLVSNVEATPASGGTTNLYEHQIVCDEYIKLRELETVYSGQTSPRRS